MAKNENEPKLSKEELKAQKLEAKKEKAQNKKDELAEKIEEMRELIAAEPDEKAKKKLRKQRDELVAQRDGITTSKDGMTIPLAPKTKRIITSCIAVVIVIALLCTYVATGAVRHGLMSYFGAPQSTFTGMVITDNDGKKHNIKVATYNYYFAMTYNNLHSRQQSYEQYGLNLGDYNLDVDFDQKLSKQTTTNDDGEEVTWAKYIQEEVYESILSTYTYYFEAVKANDGKEPEINKDQQEELDKTLSNYTETAQGYGFTLDGYLTAAMGKGVNEKLFRSEAKISYIAENYQEEYKNDLLKKEYTEEDYESYKKDNYDDLVSVDIKLFECDSEDDAKEFASKLNKNGSNFADLASEYSKEDADKQANKDESETMYVDMTRATLKSAGFAIAQADTTDDENSEVTYSGLDWIYSEDREAGDVNQQSTSVVYIVNPVYLSTTNPVTVRHILVTPFFDAEEDADKKDASEATQEEWDKAYNKAKEILDEYNAGEKTADSFAALAQDNSEDSNASKGGIYENVVPNQMVASFNDWCFDSSRQEGDTAIVKTKYGYHIMYFESTNELPLWKYTAQQALASNDSTDVVKELEDSYSIKASWFGSRYFQKDTDIDS